MWLDQCFEALFDRISAGPLLAKPIRVVVSSSFHDGIECQQIQCLLGSIFHGGDTERAHRLTVRLDRKSTRLNSSHSQISYAVFCLKIPYSFRNASPLDTDEDERAFRHVPDPYQVFHIL